MAYWKEPADRIHSCSILSPDWKLKAIYQYRIRPEGFEIFLRKWAKDTPVRSEEWEPDGWIELWPKLPILAEGWAESGMKAYSLLQRYRVERFDDDFITRPYQPPIRPEILQEVIHESKELQASIVLHDDGRFEIWYAAYEEVAGQSGHHEPTWDWMRLRSDIRTYADNYGDAIEIAKIELDQLANIRMIEYEMLVQRN